MSVLDIHTHRFYEEPGISILNCLPRDFTPFPDRYYSVGYHPWYLSKDGTEDWDVLEKQIALPEVLAVGETGLDKLADTPAFIQQAAFEKHIELASQIGKPVVIHCVKMFNEVIRYKLELKPGTPWVIHGFRGKKELAQELIHHGFYLSFGEKYQDEALMYTPLDRVFIETDESTVDIKHLYERAAAVMSIPATKFRGAVQENVRKVFFSG